MGKKSGNGSSRSFVNLASCIAIIFAIVVWIIQIVNHYVPDISILGNIAGALDTIKNVLLALVVVICALGYAGSLQNSGWKTTVYVFCAVYIVLLILGIILL